MANVNKAIIVGRLGQDPEIRHTQSGTAVANFSVATSESWKKDGERKESTEWHNIVVWDKTAEACGTYLAKGRMVYVEGKLQTQSWEKDGVTRYKTEIVAQRVEFLGGKDEQRAPNAPPRQDTYDMNEDEEDIPF